MYTRFLVWLKNALANLSIIGKEPIIVVGLAMEALHAYEQAQGQGLSVEDAAVAAVIAILTLLGRQLVYPANKIDAATGQKIGPVEPDPLEKPYVG